MKNGTAKNVVSIEPPKGLVFDHPIFRFRLESKIDAIGLTWCAYQLGFEISLMASSEAFMRFTYPRTPETWSSESRKQLLMNDNLAALVQEAYEAHRKHQLDRPNLYQFPATCQELYGRSMRPLVAVSTGIHRQKVPAVSLFLPEQFEQAFHLLIRLEKEFNQTLQRPMSKSN